MGYDREEIENRIFRKRKIFIIYTLSLLLCMIVALIFILVGWKDTLTFVMIVALLFSLGALSLVCSKFTPAILFRSEIRGTNILEVEYVSARNTSRMGLSRPKGSQFRLRFGSGANKKTIHNGRIRSTVYLRLDDGNVHAISDLYKSSTDIYEIGDILVKYAGAKYPVIENRTVQRQPCPLCGEVNDMTRDACASCNLKILPP